MQEHISAKRERHTQIRSFIAGGMPAFAAMPEKK
jgi:hypothetical protein